jgi:hypothetical protein
MRFAIALVLLAGVALAGAAAAEDMKHSGTITEIAPNRITILEMGPWAGSAALERRSIDIDQQTTVALAERVDDTGPAGWPGGFRETPLSPSDLRVGDYVTVTTTKSEAGRLVAASISVVRPSEAASASPR